MEAKGIRQCEMVSRCWSRAIFWNLFCGVGKVTSEGVFWEEFVGLVQGAVGLER